MWYLQLYSCGTASDGSVNFNLSTVISMNKLDAIELAFVYQC